MGSQQEIEWLLKLRDEASAQWKQHAEQVKSANAEISKSTVSASGAIESHGKQVKSVSQWIKEQRKEQAEQNFLFRQGREVMAAASIGLALFGGVAGATSASMQKLSDAANGGFVAFQGVGNMLNLMPAKIQAMLGPWGLVIPLLAGVATTFFKVTQNAADATAQMQAFTQVSKDYVAGIGKEQAELERDRIQQMVNMAEANKRAAESELVLVENLSRTNKTYHGRKAAAQLVIDTETRFIASRQIQLRDLHSIIEAENQRSAVEKRAHGVRMEQQADWFDAVTQIRVPLKTAADAMPAMTRGAEDFSKKMKTVVIPSTKAAEDAFNDIAKNTLFENLSDRAMYFAGVTQLVGSTLVSSFQSAFAGAEGSGRGFLRSLLMGFIDMVQGMVIASYAAAYAKAVPTFGLSLGADLPNLFLATAALQTARFLASRFHQGGSAFINAPAGREVPILVRGQESVVVRTPEQQSAGAFGGAGGNTFYFHFSSPVPHADWVVESVLEKMRQTGLTVDKLLVNQRSGIALS